METQRIEAAETPGYRLAYPEFFHLLQKIEQAKDALRREIKEVETVLRQEIGCKRTVMAIIEPLKTEGIAVLDAGRVAT